MEEIVGTIESLAADNRERHKATNDAITNFSAMFQENSDEVAMFVTECLGSLKSALMESRKCHKEQDYDDNCQPINSGYFQENKRVQTFRCPDWYLGQLFEVGWTPRDINVLQVIRGLDLSMDL